MGIIEKCENVRSDNQSKKTGFISAMVLAAGLAILPSCAATHKSTEPVAALTMDSHLLDAAWSQRNQEKKAANAVAKEADALEQPKKTVSEIPAERGTVMDVKPSATCDFESAVAIDRADPVSNDSRIAVGVLIYKKEIAPQVETLRGAALSVYHYKGDNWLPVPGCEALLTNKVEHVPKKSNPGVSRQTYYAICDFSKAKLEGSEIMMRVVFEGNENVCASSSIYQYSYMSVR